MGIIVTINRTGPVLAFFLLHKTGTLSLTEKMRSLLGLKVYALNCCFKRKFLKQGTSPKGKSA